MKVGKLQLQQEEKNLLKELNEKYSNIHSFPLDVTDSEKMQNDIS